MKSMGVMRTGVGSLAAFWLILMAAATAGEPECSLANAGFEQGREAWGHWGGEDTQTDFYGFKAFEGERFARLWGQSGSYQDAPLESRRRYGARVYAAVSSSHPLVHGMYGELKIEWRHIENHQDRPVGQIVVSFDTAGERSIKMEEGKWTLIEIAPSVPPPDATHVRAVLVAWGPGGSDGCVLFDAVELLCEKGE